MVKFHYNPIIIIILNNHEEPLSNYKFYIIAKKHFFRRSGIFEIYELLNILHKYYNYKSLRRYPGNNRKKIKEKLIKRFRNSLLFRELTKSKFSIVPERYVIHGCKGKK